MRPSHFLFVFSVVTGLLFEGCTKQLDSAQTAARRVSSILFGTATQEAELGLTTAGDDSSRQAAFVKTIDLSLEVNRCDETISQLGWDVRDLGGEILTSKVESPENSERTALILLKVPAPQVDSLLVRVHRIAKRVESEGIRRSDIRGQLAELDSRLALRSKAEAQYIEMLGSARTSADRLDISRTLLDTREKMAELRENRGALMGQVAFPQVKISLKEKNPLDDPARPGFWKKIRRGFEQGGNEIADVLSWIIRLFIAGIPVMALLLFLVLGILRVVVNRRQPEAERSRAPQK